MCSRFFRSLGNMPYQIGPICYVLKLRSGAVFEGEPVEVLSCSMTRSSALSSKLEEYILPGLPSRSGHLPEL